MVCSWLLLDRNRFQGAAAVVVGLRGQDGIVTSWSHHGHTS
jgi:hypothetical protein